MFKASYLLVESGLTPKLGVDGKILAKAVLITERIRKKNAGEAKAEEIVRKFRDKRRGSGS